jgi:hypothetical protein
MRGALLVIVCRHTIVLRRARHARAHRSEHCRVCAYEYVYAGDVRERSKMEDVHEGCMVINVWRLGQHARIDKHVHS